MHRACSDTVVQRVATAGLMLLEEVPAFNRCIHLSARNSALLARGSSIMRRHLPPGNHYDTLPCTAATCHIHWSFIRPGSCITFVSALHPLQCCFSIPTAPRSQTRKLDPALHLLPQVDAQRHPLRNTLCDAKKMSLLILSAGSFCHTRGLGHGHLSSERLHGGER